jgi:hypothetical protein
MNKQEIQLAAAMAKDYDIDLSHVDDGVLYGFGCSDFKPVMVSIETVAKCMRWQCSQFNGGWDEKQFNEDLPYYRRNVTISDITSDVAIEFLQKACASRMSDAVVCNR